MSTAQPTALRRSLDELLSLQAIDSQRDRVTRARGHLDSGATLQAASDAARDESERVRKQLTEDQRSLKDSELELAGIESKLKLYEQRQSTGGVTNAREIANIQREIGQLIRQRGVLDDKILALMEQVETGRNHLQLVQNRARETEQALTTFQDERRSKLNELDAELSRLNVERGAVTAAVTDSAILQRYEALRIRPASAGVAAARIVEQHCTGCHNQVSSNDSDKVREAETIVICESCGRILAAVG